VYRSSSLLFSGTTLLASVPNPVTRSTYNAKVHPNLLPSFLSSPKNTSPSCVLTARRSEAWWQIRRCSLPSRIRCLH